MKYFVGIDLGGTNIKGGVVDENYKILLQKSIKTKMPRPAAEIIDDIAALILGLIDDAALDLRDVQWVGIGTAGVVNSETGVVYYSTNLDFYDVDMKTPIESGTKLPVYIDNDANAAAYGQYLAGSNRNWNSLIAVTLGTGVGGGVIIDGKILKGFNHSAGELGHMVIHENGHPCGCGRKGCLEQYASATALIRETKIAMEQHPESLMWSLCDGAIENVSGRTSFDGMKQGDRVATHIVNQYINSVACGIVNFVNIFQPEAIFLCGGISKEGSLLVDPITEILRTEDYGRYSERQTELFVDTIGKDAGIIGAAFLGELYSI